MTIHAATPVQDTTASRDNNCGNTKIKHKQFAKIHQSALQLLADNNALQALGAYCHLVLKADYNTGEITAFINEIYKPLQINERTAWNHIKKLEDLGLLRRRKNKISDCHNRATTFILPLLLNTGVQPDDDRGAADCTAAVHQDALNIQTESESGSGPAQVINLVQKRRTHAVGDKDRLVQSLQQSASKPGWLMDKARPVILDAIKRFGIDAVRALAEDVRGSGLTAYQIEQRLHGLQAPLPPRQGATPPPPPRPQAPTPSTQQQRDDRHLRAEQQNVTRLADLLPTLPVATLLGMCDGLGGRWASPPSQTAPSAVWLAMACAVVEGGLASQFLEG